MLIAKLHKKLVLESARATLKWQGLAGQQLISQIVLKIMLTADLFSKAEPKLGQERGKMDMRQKSIP